ncbi:MAG: hypothetical protein Q8L48_30590 [Archangium sp.]|nr:hypothetical protein [Archangium sp.]
MTTPRFSNGDALRFGWLTTRAHLAPLLVLGATGLVLGMFSQALGRGGAGGALLTALVQVAQVAVMLLMTRASMKLFDGEHFDLANPAPLLEGFWRYLLVVFLFGLITAIGFALLIVPGVLLGLAFGFAPFFAVDGQRDPVEAFRASSRLTRGFRGQLFLFALLLMGVNLLGVLALGVGVVITVPMSVVAAVYAFRRLQGRTEAATPHVPSMTPRAV